MGDEPADDAVDADDDERAEGIDDESEDFPDSTGAPLTCEKTLGVVTALVAAATTSGVTDLEPVCT